MIYLLYGEDNYIKNEFLKKIKKNFGELSLGINYVQIDEDNIQSIISDIETPAFGYESKLIVARNCGLLKKKNSISEKLAEYIEKSASSNSKANSNIDNSDASQSKIKEDVLNGVELVIIEDDIDKSDLYKVIEKYGTIKECNEAKLPELIKKVKEITSAYGVAIQENTASYFIECVRNEYGRYHKRNKKANRI